MNDNFWEGFEKQAFVSRTVGKIVGTGSRLVSTAKRTVKGMLERSKREYTAGKLSKMGPEVRKELGLAHKMDQVAKESDSPSIVEKAKSAKNLLIAGGALGAAGLYYGLKDPQNEQLG